MINGVEYDKDVWDGLEWLASTQPDKNGFYERLAKAQRNYIAATTKASNFCKPFDPSWYGSDAVAGFFSQTKSLLDNRRAYELSTASHIIPWVKRLGQCAELLNGISGAKERANRMLLNEKVVPDTALFELVLAGNYAAQGYDVEFIPEQKGKCKTPEFKCSIDGEYFFFVECKRLQKGLYERQEKASHLTRAHLAELQINTKKMNIWLDVTYTCEVKDTPEDYLIRHLSNFKGVIYKWEDEYGCGFIKPYDFGKIKKDISEEGSLLFSVKLTRLIKGSPLEDENYDVFATGRPDERDSRYITSVKNASLVTWRCVSEKSFEARSRHVTKTLAEIDEQLLSHGIGIGHIALDVDVQKDVADKRRTKNNDAVRKFQIKSDIVCVNIHYLVPRIDENSSWMIDETVDYFHVNEVVKDVIPVVQVFPGAVLFDNDFPGWYQK
ncbi:hypothetical protein [Pectobacterium versatile]|uniref:hypothetical protein n=1 Tax=Pectobacterium versatile TaxID=2488639 RepID=UPI0015DFE3FF|nr:hypothetical protein [Pectobacterium versatile]MBA0169924.1 hypothetical protein [Pectobacterium versatile]